MTLKTNLLRKKYEDFSYSLSKRMGKALSKHIKNVSIQMSQIPFTESEKEQIISAIRNQDLELAQEIVYSRAGKLIDYHHAYMRALRVFSLFITYADYMDYCAVNIATNTIIAEALMKSSKPSEGDVQYVDPAFKNIYANAYIKE